MTTTDAHQKRVREKDQGSICLFLDHSAAAAAPAATAVNCCCCFFFAPATIQQKISPPLQVASFFILFQIYVCTPPVKRRPENYRSWWWDHHQINTKIAALNRLQIPKHGLRATLGISILASGERSDQPPLAEASSPCTPARHRCTWNHVTRPPRHEEHDIRPHTNVCTSPWMHSRSGPS